MWITILKKQREEKILRRVNFKSLREKVISIIKVLKGGLSNFKDPKNISAIPILFFAFLTLTCNFIEKKSLSLFEEEVYSFSQLENFVSMISPYTLMIEEDPTLTASALAFDSDVAESEFVEKPLVLDISLPKPETPKLEQRNSFITYEVVPGDTISQIAQKFNLSTRTLADCNNLSSIEKIKPGQKLLIPPADGVIHTVERGDTLTALVKKYQGNLTETLKYNPQNLQIGQKVVIVDGKRQMPGVSRLASARNVLPRETTRTRTRLRGEGSPSNGYPWGWCTWYAAYRRNIPRNWGNAGNWLNSAKRAGYATGSEPAVGAIIVTRESFWGHVGYVEEVRGDAVIISEMNYQGWGVISRRTISKHDPVIKGYIY